ncbi:hypothetical protein GCM10017566_28450 [Amycolatopsis bartoniae]|uniref:Gluconolaconase n=1 Tax=Amycolatopsis bartoniae TaxID=941986 RepID=A0A8H9IWP9_9PSEU|nr:hypothetical protein GCM10017566_28450 [Amycolatopsis bartoniae]
MAFGPDGRLYVAEFLGGRISAVDVASGDVEVVVPPGGPVQSPDDLAFGPDGSMYLTDLVPGRVWQRTPAGEYRLVSGDVRVPNGITCVGERLFVNEMCVDGRLLELFPGGGEPVVLTGGLAMGNAMQLGPDGHLYYPHMLTGQVFRISPDGGAPEVVAEDVLEPVAVRFDLGGTLLVLSRGAAGVITRIGPSGGRTLVTTGIPGLDNAAFDAENRMFVSSFASGGIAEVHPDGRTRPVVPQGLAGPFGVAADRSGTVFAADHYRVVVTTGNDVVTRELRPFTHGIAERDGHLHTTSQYGEVCTDGRKRVQGLDEPTGIAVRDDGTLVVAENGAGRVVAVDGQDEVTVLAEGFGRPVDVALDGDQRCYVSDESRGAVYRIDDGVPVPVVEGLDAPQGLAVRGDELFVLETGCGRLRAVDLATGEVRTEAEDLPAQPPGSERPALFAEGMPGVPHPFAGLAAGPDGALHVSAPAEGTVLRLERQGPPTVS